MKILILADIDDFHWKHGGGAADVLLSCGDVADQVILEAAQAYACPRIFAVKGNHDTNATFADPIADLHLQVCEHGGISFGGLNGSWRYKPRGYFLYDQTEVQGLLATFPPVDVFLSHNSPRGIHDQEDEVHYGFDGLRTYIQRAKPKIVIHGHQHLNKETKIDQTRIIGVFGHRVIEI
jgi:Icc-related predicted phosphoesterase